MILSGGDGRVKPFAVVEKEAERVSTMISPCSSLQNISYQTSRESLSLRRRKSCALASPALPGVGKLGRWMRGTDNKGRISLTSKHESDNLAWTHTSKVQRSKPLHSTRYCSGHFNRNPNSDLFTGPSNKDPAVDHYKYLPSCRTKAVTVSRRSLCQPTPPANAEAAAEAA